MKCKTFTTLFLTVVVSLMVAGCGQQARYPAQSRQRQVKEWQMTPAGIWIPQYRYGEQTSRARPH